MLRLAHLLWELNVDAGKCREREGGSRKKEDGQMTESGGSWKSESVLRWGDDGGGGDQDGARGQQNAEGRGRRRGHCRIWPEFRLLIFILFQGIRWSW